MSSSDDSPSDFLSLRPIGKFLCSKIYPQDASKQSSIDSNNGIAEVRLTKGFGSALDDIEGFSHIWLIYLFHRNHTWKPKVLPPRFSETKKGVFSTRSPYRPNPIGMSCVELVRRKDSSLWVRKFDLLNETPILDIKPYLSYADSFPEASSGWMEIEKQILYSVVWSPVAQQQLEFLKTYGVSEIQSFAENQLSAEPFNSKKKRLLVNPESRPTEAVLCYRTWRIQFRIKEDSRTTLKSPDLEIEKIFSGYTSQEIQQVEDPYSDKELHRRFRENFNES